MYTQTCARIYRLLLKMTANPEDACDLSQQTYVKAFARIDQFDGHSSVATWLYRIAVNEALQFLRRAKQTRVKLQAIATQRDAATNAEHTTEKLDVREALSLVPSADRAILLLRYHQGLDYRAIAEVLDCAPGTVASRLNRARDKMRLILQKGYSPSEESEALRHPKKQDVPLQS